MECSLGKAGASVGLLGAKVGVMVDPNINTGVGLKQGDFEVKVLGFGGAIGKHGVGISTPLGGVGVEGLTVETTIEDGKDNVQVN